MASHLFKIATFLISEYHHFIAVVQSFTCVQLFATPWPAAHQASLSFTNSQSFLKLTSIESIMPSNHLILCCPLLLLPLVFPRIRVFSNESALHIRWQKYWSFSLSISPSNEYSWLISFRIDWFDMLAAQGTFKSLLQHHGLNHQFFSVQPSLCSNCLICSWLLEKPLLWLYGSLLAKWYLYFLICCLFIIITCLKYCRKRKRCGVRSPLINDLFYPLDFCILLQSLTCVQLFATPWTRFPSLWDCSC